MIDAIYINSYGLVSIYSISKDKDEVEKTLEENKNKDIETFIELISLLNLSNKIKLEVDSELELKPEQYNDKFNFIFTKKFI